MVFLRREAAVREGQGQTMLRLGISATVTIRLVLTKLGARAVAGVSVNARPEIKGMARDKS